MKNNAIIYIGEWENECSLCSLRKTEQCFKNNCPTHKVFKSPHDKWVYLSGAIAGMNITERKEAFALAQERLEQKGYKVVNPFHNAIADSEHWRVHMKKDIEILLKCDYIYMLKGWELSKGAKLELDVASSCGIQLLSCE